MIRAISAVVLLGLSASATFADVTKIDLTPTDVASTNTSFFTTPPTANPALFFNRNFGILTRRVNFNTAPDGPLFEGASLTTEYASTGVTMNNIRISANIYGGNLYGTGYAAEDDEAQIYTFPTPVLAVGIVNTSPDHDRVRFYSGPNGTGTLLLDFEDSAGLPINFTIDRFVGGRADGATTIGSFVISNVSGNLELDELIFAVYATPGDTNVDGDVDFSDLLAVARNYGITTGRLWETGDFNFDQATNFNDLLTLAKNFGTSRLTLPADTSPAFQTDWTLAQSLIPEPALLSALILLTRTCRKRGLQRQT